MTLYFRPKSWWSTSRSVTIIPNESLYASLFPNYLVRDSVPKSRFREISKSYFILICFYSIRYPFIHSFIRSDIFESTHKIVRFYCSIHTHGLILCDIRFSETVCIGFISKQMSKSRVWRSFQQFEHIHCELICFFLLSFVLFIEKNIITWNPLEIAHFCCCWIAVWNVLLT